MLDGIGKGDTVQEEHRLIDHDSHGVALIQLPLLVNAKLRRLRRSAIRG